MNQGILYVVATPLGNLGDFSERARTVLAQATLILAEDTRHSAHLLRHYAINTPMMALHEHNERDLVDDVVQRVAAGQCLALISDAGTPLISDPGYRIVRALVQAGLRVSPVPGPSALVAAMSVAGLASDRFMFEGFLPSRTHARRQRLSAVQNLACTLVFYEAPHRLVETLEDMIHTFGHRQATLCRELTKSFETVHQDTLVALRDWVVADAMQQRGEMVLVVAGADSEVQTAEQSEDLRVLHLLLDQVPLRQAVDLAVAVLGGRNSGRNSGRKKWLYTAALQYVQLRDKQGLDG